MRIGLTARELAKNYALWCWGKDIPTDIDKMEEFMMRWLEQFKPVAVVTIPNYLKVYKSADAAAAKYFEKGTGKKLPKHYCNKELFKTQGILEPDGINYKWKAFPCVRQKVKKMVDFLVDANTEARVIANPKKVGKPRYQKINGQDIYNGNISKAVRNNLIIAIKNQFRQFAILCPKMKSYPVMMEVEVWDTPIDSEFSQDWDLDNRAFPYNKAFADVLKKGDCGVLDDDSIWYLTGPPAPLFCPITDPLERKLVYKVYLDRRAIVLNHPDYKKRLNGKLHE